MTDTENDINPESDKIFQQPPTMLAKSTAIVSQDKLKNRHSILPNIGINGRSINAGTPQMDAHNTKRRTSFIRNLHASAAPEPDTPVIAEGDVIINRDSKLNSDRLSSPILMLVLKHVLDIKEVLVMNKLMQIHL